MFQQIELRELAERRGSELAYVSLYASGPETLGAMKRRVERIRTLLEPDEAELEHFDESLRMIREALEGYEFRREGVAVFSCFAEDFLVGYPLTVSVPDLLRVDDSPYIRPLVELRDEYENFVVVAADARAARILLVTSGLPAGEEGGRGDVKLHAHAPSTCPVCGSDRLFPLELIEELVELATLSSARVEFVDPRPDLTGLGGVAALLRY